MIGKDRVGPTVRLSTKSLKAECNRDDHGKHTLQALSGSCLLFDRAGYRIYFYSSLRPKVQKNY
jgi:hypothetical protein